MWSARQRDSSRCVPVLVPGTRLGTRDPIDTTHHLGSTRPAPHLAAIEANPGLLTIREHLPQRHPKHPGVASMGEGARLQALRGTPGRDRSKQKASQCPRSHQPSGHKELIQQASCCPVCQARCRCWDHGTKWNRGTASGLRYPTWRKSSVLRSSVHTQPEAKKDEARRSGKQGGKEGQRLQEGTGE